MPKSLTGVINRTTRAEWIRENKDYISPFPTFPRLLLLILYIKGSLTNINRSLKVLDMTYGHINRNIKLLEQMGFIELQKEGRENRITLTKKGVDFVEVFLGLMR